MNMFSKKEASARWGVKEKTLEMRLTRDAKKVERDMLGTRKSGGNWMVSRAYMMDRFGEEMMVDATEGVFSTLEKHDIVIQKERHGCGIKFVEEVNRAGVLLVDGTEDVFVSRSDFKRWDEHYALLCRAADRHDLK